MVDRRSKYEKYKMLSQCYRYNGKMLGLIKIFQEGADKSSDKGYLPLAVNNTNFDKRTRVFENEISEERVKLLRNTIHHVKSEGSQIIIVSAPQYENSNIEKT